MSFLDPIDLVSRMPREREFPSIEQSQKWIARAQNLIPSVTQTLAKSPTQYVDGVAPKYLERGKGCHVWDVDGNEYIDLVMGVGTLALGYGNDAVDRAIRRQLEQGINFSLMHPLEVEVAELVAELVPGAEMVRFSKTGADVTSAAVRLARAFTGRSKVLCCGYHGWHDWYIGTTPRNGGVPVEVAALVQRFNYNDIESLAAQLDDRTACVIMEPVMFDVPRDSFLEQVRKLCTERGALLVFDEMWTGFRLALGGAQEYFKIQADLATFSKAIANGMPISVLTGRRDVLRLCDEDVFFSTTFGGETLSLAAVKATVAELRDKDVPSILARRGTRLQTAYNEIASRLGLDFTWCIGYPYHSLVTFDGIAADLLLCKSLVGQEMIRRGILWNGFHNICYTHEESDMDTVIAAYEEVLPILGRAVQDGKISERLYGKPVEPIFRDSAAGTRTAAGGSGGTAAGTGSRLGSVHTANFGPLLQQLGCSLLVTTYQAGKLVVLRHDWESASVNTHFAGFAKPMGLAVAPNRIAVGTALGIFELHNVPTTTDKLKPAGRYDACFLPRGGHVTGDIAIHEMAYAGDELWFVNTRFSCLCVHDGEHSFIPRWRPRFITRLVPEDRCHLNGIGVVDGLPRYVTAHGATDTAEGWRETKKEGGILVDIETQEVIACGLSMPHSPRWYGDRLWVLDSGRGGLGYIDLRTGRYEAVIELPGFTRGLDFAGNLAFVGLSQGPRIGIF